MQMCSVLRTIFHDIEVNYPDHIGSHENLFQGCKTDPITNLKLCNVYSFFPHFSSIFDISINIHEYVNEIVFI